MAKPNASGDSMRERCATCDEVRAHEISIDLLVGSEDGADQNYSRDPYRIAECQVCGSTTKVRLTSA